MIIDGILAVIKFIVLGVISMLPTLPTVSINNLDGVFQVLSMVDLIVDVRVLSVCLSLLFLVTFSELIWHVIMWVVRKLPFLK